MRKPALKEVKAEEGVEKKPIELKRVLYEFKRSDTIARTCVNMLAGYGLYCVGITWCGLAPTIPGIVVTSVQAQDAEDETRMRNIDVEVKAEQKRLKAEKEKEKKKKKAEEK